MDLRLDTNSEATLDGTNPISGGLGADLQVDAFHQYVRDDGLRTAVYLSLFTDRLADEDDRLPHDPAEPFPDRRGYWADFLVPVLFPALAGFRLGSRLWLLRGRTLTTETTAEARAYCAEALVWLETLGIGIAEVATGRDRDRLLIDAAVIDSLTGSERRFSFVWDAMVRGGV